VIAVFGLLADVIMFLVSDFMPQAGDVTKYMDVLHPLIAFCVVDE
jgi:hypothetical protein